ncbi:MAG: hypothetical protein EAZ42_08945 [Verrucomicrobia bacterium]|nr:MAG: hypothetical protein EAZ42_08945 [Verrucomicrobiota bacterium]
MKFISSRWLPITLVAVVCGVSIVAWWHHQTTDDQAVEAPVKPPRIPLSALSPAPVWSLLDIYQESISRERFQQLVEEIYVTGDGWKEWLEIQEDAAVILTGLPSPKDRYVLKFSEQAPRSAPRFWRTADELPPTTADRPLQDLHIAIDPGHIGGDWAKVEERWFIVGDGKPVMEGNMTLDVALLMKPRLEALGANVSLIREKNEPLTLLRPADLLENNVATAPNPSGMSPQKLAERLFYRTAEIHARAQKVNNEMRPDLVLCLHFNAEAWGDPNHPRLIDRTHFHILLHGAYSSDETKLLDQRHRMVQKLLSGSHDEELRVGSTLAREFARTSGLPAYQYPPLSFAVREIKGEPFLWARNLLANRLFDCPVLYIEPYVMNSTIDYARIQAGDYDGLREVSGKMQPSIFREYADGLVQGLKLHYLHARKLKTIP